MSGSQEVFHARIAATDDTSGVVAAIKAHLAQLGLTAHKVGEDVKHIHQPGVWSELREHTAHTSESFAQMGEHVSSVGEKLAELVPAIGAVGAAGGLVAMLETTEKVAEAYGELAHTAESLGISAQRLHEFNIVAKLSDTNAESMDKSMAKLNRTLGEAGAGKNKEAAALFRQLHLNPKSFKDSADALPALANAFQHTTDATMRARMAQVLFGRAGTEMIPLLMRGSGGIRELQEEARKLGFNFTDSGAGLEKYNESMKRLGVATDSFKDAIGADLAPVLRPLVEDITDIVAANRDWLAQDMAGEVRELATWIRAVPWPEVGKEISGWAHDAEWFVEKIGGAKTVVEVLAGAMVMKGAVFLFAETVQVGKFAIEAAIGIGRLIAMAAAWVGVGAAATEAAAAEEIANKAAGGGAGGAAKTAAKVLAGGAAEEAGGAALAAGSGASVAGAAAALGGGAVAGAGALAVAVPLAVGLKTAADALDRATGMDKYEAQHVNAGQRAGTRGADNGPRHVAGGQMPTHVVVPVASSAAVPPGAVVVAVRAQAPAGPSAHRGAGPASPDPSPHGGRGGVTPGPSSSPAAQSVKLEGEVKVKVDMTGAPPGTTATATGTGAVGVPKVNIGQAFHDHDYN